MSNNGKKFDYVDVGAMLQKKDQDDQGRPVYWLKFDDKVEVKVNGVKVKALNIQRPTDKYDRMLAKGTIDENEYEEKMARYEDKGDLSYVKFQFTATLDKK